MTSKIRLEALNWLKEAWADLKHAKNSLKCGDFNWSCFAAQQAAEKALKALLMGVGRKRAPHFLDLVKLYDDVKGEVKLPEDIAMRLGELSSYYTIARYPNAGLMSPSLGITILQAESAIEIAEKVVKIVEKKLT